MKEKNEERDPSRSTREDALEALLTALFMSQVSKFGVATAVVALQQELGRDLLDDEIAILDRLINFYLKENKK